MISQQVSSLSCLQWLTRKCTTNRSKICWNKGSILHRIICVYILYEFCIQIVYIHNVYDVHFLQIRTDVYKMYTNCLYIKCIPYFDKFLYTLCIQNVYKMFVYKIYLTFRQTSVYKMFVYKMYPILRQTCVYILCTKFSWHSSFDFELILVWYTFCIHFAYISCIHLVQFLYTKCMHSFCVCCNNLAHFYQTLRWVISRLASLDMEWLNYLKISVNQIFWQF